MITAVSNAKLLAQDTFSPDLIINANRTEYDCVTDIFHFKKGMISFSEGSEVQEDARFKSGRDTCLELRQCTKGEE